jgi:DNA-binding transcriptional LysR family regulator
MHASDLDGLVAFCLVAERRSFTAAAAELRVTRSAVSQSIKALETSLGVAVLARTTRDVGLTEAGERLHAAIKPALETISLARQALSASVGRPSGLLRLNVPRVAVATVIAPLLPAFRAAYPDIVVEIFTEDRFANIIEGGFDAGVRLGELVERDMVSVRLTPSDRLCVVGAPAYFARHGMPAHPRDLAAHACINFRQSSRGGLYRWEFVEEGEDFDVGVDGGLIVNDTDMKLRAAIDGLGLAYELHAVARPFIEAGLLVEALAPYSTDTPGFYLYFPARAQVLPKLRAFIDFVKR